MQPNRKSMKKVLIVMALCFCLLLALGGYVERYSKESFKIRTGMAYIKDTEDWSDKKYDSIVTQKEDSLLDAYFPIISALLK